MAAMRSIIAGIILLKVLLMILIISPSKTNFDEKLLIKEENYREEFSSDEHLIDFANFSYTIEQPSCGRQPKD